MIEFTPSQIQSLSGRDLDRAVCELWPEIATKTGMHSWPAAGIPSLHSEAVFLHLAFEPGGPLEPTGFRHYIIVMLNPIVVWKITEETVVPLHIASGPTIETAVWRAACIVALESQTKGTESAPEGGD